MFFRQFTMNVRNLEDSIAFYESMTQLKITRRLEVGPGKLAFLSNGNGETEIELVSVPGMQPFEGKGFFLCFLTERLDEMHALALEKGRNPSDIRNPDPQNRYFYVYDPDGVSIQLKQIP